MKLPSWREAEIARTGPHPTRLVCDAAWVLTQLQNGAVLYSGRIGTGRSRWWMLDDGRSIHGTTARKVIADPRVVDCGDSLFAGVRGQTFRYTEKLEGEEPE
jgi:hypothetical protein